jgi:antitoxin (DNA-binding transcriptional repressor) of toxin-antitoxin stability system
MNASVVDLRYRSSDIMNALDHGEKVVLFYHGKPKGTIIPLEKKQTGPVSCHPFFGMSPQEGKPVEEVMEDLRGSRYDF